MFNLEVPLKDLRQMAETYEQKRDVSIKEINDKLDKILELLVVKV